MRLELLVVKGPDPNKVFTLHAGPDQMLGRGKQCLYRLNDPRVPGRIARSSWRENRRS